MKRIPLILLPFLMLPALVRAQVPAPAAPAPAAADSRDAGFEEPPVLSAAAILRPEWLSGPHHKVRDEVPTYAGENWYVIDSDAGTFEAAGNVMLQNRIAEIYAILQLRQIAKGKTYGEAVKAAAKSPFVMAKNLIERPVDTVAAVPKGVFKLVNRTGRALKDATSGRQKSDYEDPNAAALLGVSRAKRELAFQYGVSPYSSNSVLQKELNSLAWTSFAGKATVGVLTAGMAGGDVENVLKLTRTLNRNAVRLRDTSPVDLRRENKEALLRMGVNDGLAEQFLANPALSPAHQTGIVTALDGLQGVRGRADYISLAAVGVENETDASFFEQTASLLARVHAESAKLQAITPVDGIPVCVGLNGTTIVALHWDYAAWTERAAAFIDDLKATRPAGDKAKLAVMITGQMSPLARRQLETRGIQAFDRVIPGPLK